MRKILFIILPFLSLLTGCHPDDCVCSTYETCIGNRCQCGQWAEGDTCTPMRNKFAGTWIGHLYLNGANPQPDTISFIVVAKSPINYLLSTTGNFGIYMRFSTQVNYFTDYPTGGNSYKEIDSGIGLLSPDQKTLTLTYLPVINPGIIDSTNEYTFIGTKQ
jgi:hypothetical protein